MAAAQRTINRPSWWAVSLTVGLAVALLLVAPSIPAAADAPRARDLERDWRFVERVLLSSEYTSETSSVSRWSFSPVYWVAVESAPHLRTTMSLIERLNGFLAPHGIAIHAVTERPERYDGVVGVIERDLFPRMLGAAGCRVPTTQLVGVACVKSEVKTGKIGSVSILVDATRSDQEFESTMLEELFHSLGVTNDQDIFSDSIVFEDADGSTVRNRLAPIDIQVLRFLYMYLEPGDDAATVRAKFEAHWADVPVD